MNNPHLPAPTMNAASSGGEFHSARYAGQLHSSSPPPTIRRRRAKVATRLKEPTRLKDMVVTRRGRKERREAIRRKERREAIRRKAREAIRLKDSREAIRLKAREAILSKGRREATRHKAIRRRAATRRSP
jgi:hypothetical protein